MMKYVTAANSFNITQEIGFFICLKILVKLTWYHGAVRTFNNRILSFDENRSENI